MTGPDDARTIDPGRTFDPLTSAPTLAVATPTPTPAAHFTPGAIIAGATGWCRCSAVAGWARCIAPTT